MHVASYRTVTAILVVTLLLFAGCAGKRNDVPPADTEPNEPIVTNDTGSIAGLVVSEEVLGIGRAELLIQETQQSTRSGADGRFALNGVAPGVYNVFVSALGYESQAARLEVVAGEITEKTFTMREIIVRTPHHESIPFSGRFECSTALVDVVWLSCPATDETGGEPSINFTKPEGVTYMVLELQWVQASAGTGQNLDFNLVQDGRDEEQWYANVFGPSPLKIVIQVGEKYDNAATEGSDVGSPDFDQVVDDEDTALQLDIYSSPVYLDEMVSGAQREALVGVTVQQNFSGYITFFYDMVPPEEYSAFGDA